MTLKLADRLRLAVRRAEDENDLPGYLAERVLAVVDRVDRESGTREEIERLIDQLGDYDTYGQTGYLGMGVNNLILEKTIEKIESRIGCADG